MKPTFHSSEAPGVAVGEAWSPGLVLAGGTAMVSGVSVFVNSYGVRAISSPAAYTTAKNLVAFIVLAAAATVASSASRRKRLPARRSFVLLHSRERHQAVDMGPAAWIGLTYVGVVGGGIAFILFFEGLARTAATPAAFWHDTLIIWVAVLARPILGERLRWWNAAAIALLMAGQITLAHGVGRLAASQGEMLVLAATLMWSLEVVVAKRLLTGFNAATLSLARMGVGTLTLLIYLVATGNMHVLLSFGSRQIGWVLLSGLLLAAYVGTWMSALAGARAVDVSSVLVASVFVTALLQGVAGTAEFASQVLGLLLVVMGASLVLVMGFRRRPPVVEA